MRLKMLRYRSVNIVVILFFLLRPEIVFSLDESRLWLPVSYQTLYLQLKDAAQKAESLERCESILDGTIDLDNSTPSNPVFRFRCRQPNKTTYTEMVDGLTMRTLSTPVAEKAPPTEQELEQLRLAEERQKLAGIERRKEALWEKCEAAVERKTSLMINVVQLSEEMPQPELFNENMAVYALDFDAESVSGDKLEFRAKCTIENDSDLRLELGKRPD